MIAGGCIRRGEDEAPNARLPSGFEQSQRLGDVDVERAEGIADRIRDPCSGSELDDRVGARDCLRDGGTIRQGRSNQLVGNPVEVREPADREVVENPDSVTAFDEQPDERRADEAGTAGDEDRPVQRRCAPADTPIPVRGSGAQRTFWTNTAGSMRSRRSAILASIVSMSSSSSKRGCSPSSMSLECWAL